GGRRGRAELLRRLRPELPDRGLLGRRRPHTALGTEYAKGLSGAPGRGLRPPGRPLPVRGPAGSIRRVGAGRNLPRGVGPFPAAAPVAGARVTARPEHVEPFRPDDPRLPVPEPPPLVFQPGHRAAGASGAVGGSAPPDGEASRPMRRAPPRLARRRPAPGT